MWKVDKGRLVKWVFVRILFPLVPLAINLLVSFIFGYHLYGSQWEKGLIFIFLLPVIYIQEIEDLNARYALYIVSFVSIVLYCCYLVAVNGSDAPDQKALDIIKKSVFILAIIELVSAFIYEFRKSIVTE